MINRQAIRRCTTGRAALATLATISIVLGAMAGVSGCGGVKVQAEPMLPPALISPLALTVGVYYSKAFRTYVHQEDRWGTSYELTLGPGHVRLADQLFRLEFQRVVPVENLSAAPREPALAAIVEPRIERFSFLTARDTGGEYFAVTIDYRLNLFNAAGERIDSFTFVGYGSAPSKGARSSAPLFLATRAAMRDAAAKFLVQFPEQGTVKKLLAGATVEPLSAGNKTQEAEASTSNEIEAVPIEERKPEPAKDAPKP